MISILMVRAAIVARVAASFDPKWPLYILLGCVGLFLLLGVLSFFLPALRRRESELPDRYWKLGIFYLNPEDDSIFVPKRFGIGYTLNFARPVSWFVLALIFIVALAPLVYAVHFIPGR